MFRVLTIALAALSLTACHKPAMPDQSAAAKTFMAKNASEPGVQTLPDGLQYKIIKSGAASGVRPQRMDEVKVNYEGKLVDGTVFDSSYERGQPASMPLKGLIPAWQEALTMMRPGDVWMLYVPPSLGYGDQGAGGVIPPGAALIFKIELIDVLPGVGNTANG
jgi:FKBP-type peptidyl-prolyl cis-trans isomerase